MKTLKFLIDRKVNVIISIVFIVFKIWSPFVAEARFKVKIIPAATRMIEEDLNYIKYKLIGTGESRWRQIFHWR